MHENLSIQLLALKLDSMFFLKKWSFSKTTKATELSVPYHLYVVFYQVAVFSKGHILHITIFPSEFWKAV